jgi:hypothetical protein
MLKLLLTTSAVFAVACSGDDGGSDPSSWDTNDPEQFCRGAAEYECSAHFDCVEEDSRDYASMLACQQVVESKCEAYLKADPLKTYSPANAATCLEDMSTRGCLDVNEPWLDAKCDGITVAAQGKLQFVWTSALPACQVDPGVGISIELTGNGQNYKFPTASCGARQTVESPSMPLGSYSYTALYYYSDGSGPGTYPGAAKLDKAVTTVSLQ